MKGRSLQVAFLAFMLIGACNKDEFYGTSVQIEGADAACSEGTDVASCEAISGCQVAYEDVESVEPVFASCIANPPEEEVIVNPPNTNPPPVTNPNPPVMNPPVVIEENEVPTVEEAYEAKCENLDDKYLLIKNYSGKGQSHRVKKVKVCHKSAKDEHAIIVAFPELKANKSHDDYLGACKE